MSDVVESVARVGLAAWVGAVGESERFWDAPPVLGTIGDQLYLLEIDGGDRERVLQQLVDEHADDAARVRVEIALFGDAGGFFASSLSFFERWPKSMAELPVEVLVDERSLAAFTRSSDGVVVSVRHALRPSDAPPRRRLRFGASTFDESMSAIARQARALRDDLLAVAQERAPRKLESLRRALGQWPA